MKECKHYKSFSRLNLNIIVWIYYLAAVVHGKCLLALLF